MEQTEKNNPFACALSYFLGKKWGSGSALSRSIGRSNGYISELGSGKKRGDEEVRRVIASHFGLTYEDFLSLGRWILDGNNPEDWKPPVRGEISAKLPAFKATVGATSTEPSNISPAPPSIKRIPIVSWVNAGDWSKAVDPFHPGYAEDWIDTAVTSNINAFALVVHGDSMEPEFTEGDIITVDPGRAYCSGSFVVAKNGEEATFKQLILDGTNVFLKPLNERYPIKDMTGVEMRIVGVVVEKRKRY